MGTRGLTIVKSAGTFPVSQYGQWDHYPDGQGLTALRFCREYLATPAGRERFKEDLKKVRFIGEGEHARLWEAALGKPSSENGYEKVDDCKQFARRFPALDRDLGAGVLEYIAKHDGEVLTSSQLDFAADSLFCEGAYMVDLDANEFVSFHGFNKDASRNTMRLGPLKEDPERDEKYAHIYEIACFSLDKLPTDEEYLAATSVEEEGEDE